MDIQTLESTEIQNQRRVVALTYAVYGDGNLYEQSVAKLRKLNNFKLAADFRERFDLGENAPTPYCEEV